MVTTVITKELAVEKDLALGKGTISQTRGGQTLTLDKISFSKVISNVAVFANDLTASESVDPNTVDTVLVEGYTTAGDGGGLFFWDAVGLPVTADSGHIFASGVITVLGVWRRITDNSILNVKNFGAKGDGVTDDTAAILAAVSAVNLKFKATLDFPTGEYNLTSPLDLSAATAVRVKGAGKQNTIIKYTGATGPLFLFNTEDQTDKDAQFVVVKDLTLRTNKDDLTAIQILSTALVTDITRSAIFSEILFIGETIADGWNFCIHSQDVRGITVFNCYARHVTASVGTIFWNIDNILAFSTDAYTVHSNETHFYENDFSALIPTGNGTPLTTLVIAVSDEITVLTTGTAKLTFRMPDNMTLTEVRASVTTAPTGSLLVVDINENGTTILSTKLTIDTFEKTSTTASIPVVISDPILADDAEITIDIDAVGATIAGAGLKITLIGTNLT